MKKIFLFALLLLFTNAAYCDTVEIFENTDINTLKAGIVSYLTSAGAKISYPFENDIYTFSAVQSFQKGAYGGIAYLYGIKLTQDDKGSVMHLNVFKTSGQTPVAAGAEIEQRVIENIKTSMNGKYLYGLGFEFEEYDTPAGKIKAPKGKQTGIKLTSVKYDAFLKGLKAGDKIIAVNNIPISSMPYEVYKDILFAKKADDKITITYVRGAKTSTVTLIPRLSKAKVF